jgi:hypothetical protein
LGLRNAKLSSARMTIRTYIIPQTKGKPRTSRTADGTDVAAKYFVYKLYEATNGQPMQWQVVHRMGETAATISRAVERGWVRPTGRDRQAAGTQGGPNRRRAPAGA